MPDLFYHRDVIIDALTRALTTSFAMGWMILWPLILGFTISGAIQAVVSKRQMSQLLPDDKPKTLALASLLGAASSSCSYAAVALARSLVKKGANFTAAMAFEIASTNLVIELGIILAVLLGWQFTAAEFVGGPIMIIILALLFRRFLTPKLLDAATRQAQKGLAGKMEGHAGMGDMSVTGSKSVMQKLLSSQGRTATSHYFVMDWASVWTDIVLGLLIAGTVAAWVPMSFFQSFFITSDPVLSFIWGPLVGPLIAVVSFVCSVGNVPLAAVLWNGGISFGGLVSFIFADLIVYPILRIYKKYYGMKMAAFLFATFYLAMVAAGYLVEIIFWLLNLTPTVRAAIVPESGITFNYTTVLNIFFLVIGAALVWRFLRTGGPAMLKMMDGKTSMQHKHDM
ncbi:MAG: permease [Candidatus Nomurabacteria bacterium]|nr:MAG: permease [Candidatus Nomurabacteria bacterium]